jgi:hypothetical protein
VPSLQVIKSSPYNGYKINKGHEGAASQWADKIIALSSHAPEVQYQPIGDVISLELCQGKTKSSSKKH